MSQAHYEFEANVSFENNPAILDNMAKTISDYQAALKAFRKAIKKSLGSPAANSASATLSDAENAMLLAGRKFAHFIRVGDAQFDTLKGADADNPLDARLCDRVFTQKYIGQHNRDWHTRNNAAKAQ